MQDILERGDDLWYIRGTSLLENLLTHLSMLDHYNKQLLCNSRLILR